MAPLRFLSFVLATSEAAAAITRARVLQGLGGAVAGVPIACEIYSRVPPRWPSPLPPLLTEPIIATTTELVVVLPGAGGPDANSDRVAAALASPKTTVIEYDWSRFTGDTLRAPYNAQRVGEHLARELLAIDHPFERVHLVGVSVGAFAVDRLCEAYVAQALPRRAAVRLTLLDPFTARGLAGLVAPATAYGVKRFGATADTAVCVFNSDDPVPSTNTPLSQCANYDVTNVLGRANFMPLPGDSLHSWPCAWFGLNGGRLPKADVKRGDVHHVLN